jgi:2-keto-4-pentenoate hydratase
MQNGTAAAELLYRLWRDGERVDQLPAELRPSSLAGAYAVQALLVQRMGTSVGWKIAATSPLAQKMLGVPGPYFGRLVAGQEIPAGENHELGAGVGLAEMEFGFRFGDRLAPRANRYSVDEVFERVSELRPSIELPLSRFTQPREVGIQQLVADNASAGRYVLGPAASADWRNLDLAAHEVRARLNGGAWQSALGRETLNGPREAVTWMVNELSALGVAIEPGQVVLSGNIVVLMPLQSGALIEADFGRLGSVSLRIA